MFDVKRLEKDESLDGFYVIESNVTRLRVYVEKNGKESGEVENWFGKKSRWLKKEGMLQFNRIVTPLDIVEMYHALWKIEQTFRITKSELILGLYMFQEKKELVFIIIVFKHSSNFFLI